MKGLGFFDKIIFAVNSLIAFLLLLSYVLPYIPPKTFPLLSVLSLGVPFLIIINAVFLVFWLIRLKKQLLLSLFVLGIGWSYVNSFYRFTSSTKTDIADSFSIMSFNVREFNVFKWLPNTEVKRDIAELVASHQPDIICLQEASRGDSIHFRGL
jgi:vancomycin resistance protein VanJ